MAFQLCFDSEMLKTTETDVLISVVFIEIPEKSRDARDRRIMFIPVEEIGNAGVVILTDIQRVARLSLIVEKIKHIDSNTEAVLVLLNIVRWNWVWETVEIVAFEQRIVMNCTIDISVTNDGSVDKVEKGVSEATIVAIVDIHNGFFSFSKTLEDPGDILHRWDYSRGLEASVH